MYKRLGNTIKQYHDILPRYFSQIYYQYHCVYFVFLKAIDRRLCDDLHKYIFISVHAERQEHFYTEICTL